MQTVKSRSEKSEKAIYSRSLTRAFYLCIYLFIHSFLFFYFRFLKLFVKSGNLTNEESEDFNEYARP